MGWTKSLAEKALWVGASLALVACAPSDPKPVAKETGGVEQASARKPEKPPSAAMTEPPPLPAGPGTAVPRFSRFAVGTPAADVSKETRPDPACSTKGIDPSACPLLGEDGAAYELLDDEVWSVSLDANVARSDVKLPFGLRFGDSTEAAVAALSTPSGRAWWIFRDQDATVMGSYDFYSDLKTAEFVVELRFVAGRLTKVVYKGPST